MQNNPGGNECALEGKGLGFESEQDLFFFQTVKILVQKNVGLLFVCLCFVGLVARSKNRVFLDQKKFTVVA